MNSEGRLQRLATLTINPEALPLSRARADHLAVMLSMISCEYDKSEHQSAHIIEIGDPPSPT